METKKTVRSADLIVIGAGASGALAAMTAADGGLRVLLLEQNEKLGKKIYITGKGRCNLTNAQEMDLHLQHIHRNPKFLYSAYRAFTQNDIVRLFESLGVPCKVERGDRVFPVSDKSNDINTALEKGLRRSGAEVLYHTQVIGVTRTENGFLVSTKNGSLACCAVVIATGGLSYPTTGATGDGYRIAKTFGHTVTPLSPSLVGLTLKDPWVPDLAGVTLKNVKLVVQGKKPIEKFGELLFTHYGISGPIVLQMSAILPTDCENIPMVINLKPALTADTLDDRMQREIKAQPKVQMSNLMRRLLPQSLIPVVLAQAGIHPETVACQLEKTQRARLVESLCELRIHPTHFRGFNEAVVTRGGVSCKEIQPQTMMSKKQDGLFFCGELIDVDADTGGYNLQIAWSTGYVAGKGAVEYCQTVSEEA